MKMDEPNLRRLVEKAARRSRRRVDAANARGVPPLRDLLAVEAMRIQDHLSMGWNAAAMAPAEHAIHESRQLAREALDLPNASERELDTAMARRLK